MIAVCAHALGQGDGIVHQALALVLPRVLPFPWSYILFPLESAYSHWQLLKNESLWKTQVNLLEPPWNFWKLEMQLCLL